jgi:GNAT superfamily N-acetyltransferase
LLFGQIASLIAGYHPLTGTQRDLVKDSRGREVPVETIATFARNGRLFLRLSVWWREPPEIELEREAPGAPVAVLTRLNVCGTYRRRGLHRALLLRAETACWVAGVKEIVVPATLRESQPADRFWTRCGYRDEAGILRKRIGRRTD